MSYEKEYEAEILFGLSTDTLDVTGNTILELDNKEKENLNKSKLFTEKNYLESILNRFIGKIKQVPPMYSAIKKDGVKMYDLARQGIELELPARDIEIYSIDILEKSCPYIKIRVKCSKGTYIRSLIRDIGLSLNIPCTMSNLRRTRTGDFKIEDAIKINELNKENIEDNLITIESLLYKFPKKTLNDKFINLIENGVRVLDRTAFIEGQIDYSLDEGKIFRYYNTNNIFKGLIKVEEGALTQIFRV